MSRYRHMFALIIVSFFFFNDTATTEIYTLSLHDALPISVADKGRTIRVPVHMGEKIRKMGRAYNELSAELERDRKSTRLNSSHANISYAVFCLKKKNTQTTIHSYTNSLMHYIRCEHDQST